MSENSADNIQDMNQILSDEISVNDTPDQLINEEEDVYYIPSGIALKCKDIYEITAREKTKMIVLAGPANSGKTTIETSLYQLFQEKTLCGMYFAGSETLQGYEQRAFPTRTKSYGSIPQTPRTNVDTVDSFLHMRVWDCDIDEYYNLLFADLSGEAYSTHIGRVEDTKKDFGYMDRADYFVCILDGELIKNVHKRNGSVSQITGIIRTFYEANLIEENCKVQVVFSKYDLLLTEENSETLIQDIMKRIRLQLQRFIPEITEFQVAAMPEYSEKVQVGYGLEDLFKSWLKKRKPMKSKETYKIDNSLSEYDKLSYKL